MCCPIVERAVIHNCWTATSKNPFYSQNPNATEPAYLIYCHQKLVMIKFRDFYKKKTAEGVLVLRLYRAGETRSPRRCSAH